MTRHESVSCIGIGVGLACVLAGATIHPIYVFVGWALLLITGVYALASVR